MGKTVKYVFAALAALLLAASCREKEGTYSFYTLCASNAREEVLNACVEQLKAVPYFREPQAYTGKYSEVVLLAFKGFSTACEQVDAAAMAGLLGDGEVFRANLVDMQDQSIVGYCYWTSDEAPALDNEP
ncbi:MAG: hypothetical protein J5871_02595 [Bacteroidales bacterium]|nr:hypothetical protein [Bacteroidales bacterium]